MHRPSSVTAANHELVTLAVELVMLLRGLLQLQWAHSVRDLNNARSKKKCTDLRASAEKKKGIDIRASAKKKEVQRPSNVTANHERHCQSRTCHGDCYAVEKAFAVGSLFVAVGSLFAYHALGALHARALRSWSLISWISVRGYTGRRRALQAIIARACLRMSQAYV